MGCGASAAKGNSNAVVAAKDTADAKEAVEGSKPITTEQAGEDPTQQTQEELPQLNSNAEEKAGGEQTQVEANSSGAEAAADGQAAAAAELGEEGYREKYPTYAAQFDQAENKDEGGKLPVKYVKGILAELATAGGKLQPVHAQIQYLCDARGVGQESSIDLVTFMQICEALFHDDVSKFPGTTEKELKKIYYQTQAIKTKVVLVGGWQFFGDLISVRPAGIWSKACVGRSYTSCMMSMRTRGDDEGAGAAVEESQECKNEQDTGDAQPVAEESGEGKEEEAGVGEKEEAAAEAAVEESQESKNEADAAEEGHEQDGGQPEEPVNDAAVEESQESKNEEQAAEVVDEKPAEAEQAVEEAPAADGEAEAADAAPAEAEGAEAAYLLEHEYLEAFSTLQRESGIKFTEGSSDCSILDRAIDMWYSAQYAAYGDSDESEGGPEDLLDGIVKEPGVTPHAVVRSTTAPHGARANPTCVVFHPTDSTLLATGGADREVKLWRDSEAGIEPTGLVFRAPSPVFCPSTGALMAHSLLLDAWLAFDAATGEEVGKSSHPTKTHVLRCQFYPQVRGDGELLLFSACRDMTVQFYERTRVEGTQDFEWRKTGLLRQAQPVSAATWLECDEPVLAMAIENDPYMHYYSGETLKNIGDYSLNPHKLDRHVSFRIRDMLSWSMDGHTFILCATDAHKLLLFRAFHHSPIRTYYGIDIDEYDNPSLAVSADRSFVLSTTTDKSGTSVHTLAVWPYSRHSLNKKVMTIPVHERGAIRHMCFSKIDDKIASVSFEKSLKIIE
ncbi:hypothetical protein FOZ60_005319 [Perkinsus olseni]|uniref:Uncharacterized protein n=1 Tax=Perkinsus olseni TaxID=32597 RepID=A0A7J6NS89_PEROL|nr:hypothetical protein FOZ60_005319 [Perkinsus olseni]